MLPTLCEKNQCSGCAACAAVCPVSAITMQQDEDGFYAPSISAEQCIQCGKCQRTCPELNRKSRSDAVYPTSFAMKLADPDTLHKSASGGMFTLLSNWVFAQGGCVYGAVWDDAFHVQLTRADTPDQLSPMRSSKYVYSHAQAAYTDAQSQLKAGRIVLFTGVPCQIAALYAVLGKEYPNLYTAEITCHGSGSEQVFDSYVDYLQNRYQKKLASVDQCSKVKPWNKLIQRYVHYVWTDGSSDTVHYTEDAYLPFYLRSHTMNNTCFHCTWTELPRQADITMGDFMGIGVVKPHKIPLKDGVSAVWINTEKGAALVKTLQTAGGALWEPCQLEECMMFNHPLWTFTPRPKERDTFFQRFHSMSYEELVRTSIGENTPFLRNSKVKRGIIQLAGAHFVAFGFYMLYRSKGLPKAISIKLETLRRKLS